MGMVPPTTPHPSLVHRHILVVPGILVVIAFTQMTCAIFGTLSPWKGGGFGMFASIDGVQNRFLSVHALVDTGELYTIVVPLGRFSSPEPLSTGFLTQTLTFPTRERLDRISEAVSRAHLVLSPGGTRMPTRLYHSRYRVLLQTLDGRPQLEVLGAVRSKDSFTGICEVRVRVLRVRFDIETGSVALAKVGPVGSVKFPTATVFSR